MNEQEKNKAIEVTGDMKRDILHLISKHAKVCSKLAVNDDPHTPVIACVQMALLSASSEFLMSVGCQAPEAVQLTLQTVNAAGQRWTAHLTMKPQPPGNQ